MRSNRWLLGLIVALAGMMAMMVPVQSIGAVPPPPDVTFSAAVFNPPDYTSCQFGIFGGPSNKALEHNWKLMVRGSATHYYIDLRVVAHAANVIEEGGSVTFTVTGPAGFVGAETVPQPAV